IRTPGSCRPEVRRPSGRPQLVEREGSAGFAPAQLAKEARNLCHGGHHWAAGDGGLAKRRVIRPRNSFPRLGNHDRSEQLSPRSSFTLQLRFELVQEEVREKSGNLKAYC